MGDRSRSRIKPGTRRGVRCGGSAWRKWRAWVQYNLNQGRQWDDIPVAHAGGQQRPLFSSKFWEPTASASEEDIAVDVIGEEQITDQVSSFEEEPAEVESVPWVVQPIQPVWLGPRPKGIPKARAGVPEFGRRDAASETISSSSVRACDAVFGRINSFKACGAFFGRFNGFWTYCSSYVIHIRFLRVKHCLHLHRIHQRKFNSNFG